ncbi:Crp/Fnr family transcriptional regulator [Streptomyces sp. SID13726]|uniref:Crp/Fnr family transcriptional regulator n=1 Tax=Streptomyces sp. SID13726 TaxID=2706058 RepID=UPI0013BCDB8F|nr:Crp/Fnr family transcriptional regulator [Streptomyces sp. SID13726]NEA99109.1 Crp/Fnr family transcriptional regulator [Streptomyces sp. SID13726]
MTQGSNLNGRMAFLDTLPPEARTAFEQLGSRRHYAGGDVLIHEGDHTQDLVVLHEGFVKVTVRLDRDRMSLMDIWIGGDVVGEGAAMGVGPRSATVTACTEVVAAVVPRSELEAFLLAHPEISLSLIQMVCGRLRRSDRLRLELGGYPVPVRLARVLVELATTYGRPDRNSLRIDVGLSQLEFAALAGARTRSVHKALGQLRDKGIISTDCRLTHVRDLAGLHKAALLGAPIS